MAVNLGVSITKSVSFRSVQQEFSNVYHYHSIGGGQGDASTLIDMIVATEKAFHSGDVSYLRGRAWTAGGTKSENEMIVDKALAGTGAQAISTTMDRERAYLVFWPAGNDSRGHPVYLRKWFHSCGSCVGTTPSSVMLQNTGQIDSTSRTTIQNKASEFNTYTIGGNAFDLQAKSGRARQGGAVCHNYLEHHQLGDMWRG